MRIFWRTSSGDYILPIHIHNFFLVKREKNHNERKSTGLSYSRRSGPGQNIKFSINFNFLQCVSFAYQEETGICVHHKAGEIGAICAQNSIVLQFRATSPWSEEIPICFFQLNHLFHFWDPVDNRLLGCPVQQYTRYVCTEIDCYNRDNFRQICIFSSSLAVQLVYFFKNPDKKHGKDQ